MFCNLPGQVPNGPEVALESLSLANGRVVERAGQLPRQPLVSHLQPAFFEESAFVLSFLLFSLSVCFKKKKTKNCGEVIIKSLNTTKMLNFY